MTALGVRSASCRRGHPWTEANTYTDSRGHRMCRRCAADKQAERRAARADPQPAPLALRPPEWTEAALCAQADPDAWFPEKGESAGPAKRICRGCPVRAECLDYAIANGERYGVWGGLSERDRRALTRERRNAA